MSSLLGLLAGFPQRLATFLDRPGFPWKSLIVGFTLTNYAFESFLSFRQYKILQQKKPPKVLEDEISQEKFDESQRYGRAKAQFGFWSGIYSQTQNLGWIYYDILPKLWGITGVWMSRYLPSGFQGEISHTLVFVLAQIGISTILSLPIDYYSTFILEEKFGFNKSTLQLWITDKIKTLGLTLVLGFPLLAAFLKIIMSSGPQFYFYLWAFAMAVQAIMITIFPIFIMPLFNKLSPLDPGPLKQQTESLASRLSFPLHSLYVIDGSKRSAHSNAYFFGLPWKKHIVIYDTLIAKSSPEEVVAVLAHELGHWSLSHTTKLFSISQAQLLYLFALFSIFISNRSLYASFGFHAETPIIIGFTLFSDVLSPTDALIKFAMNILSRRFEFAADEFAVKLGYSKELAKSLIKLQVQNLSTMDADPWYAAYHYSHPILPERLGALGWERGKRGVGKVGEVEEKEGLKDGLKKEADGVVKAADREL
ncbi:MAG: hypothetical protein Q9160_007782 [Pyrenula sp. 1 TL-2023]